MLYITTLIFFLTNFIGLLIIERISDSDTFNQISIAYALIPFFSSIITFRIDQYFLEKSYDEPLIQSFIAWSIFPSILFGLLICLGIGRGSVPTAYMPIWVSSAIYLNANILVLNSVCYRQGLTNRIATGNVLRSTIMISGCGVIIYTENPYFLFLSLVLASVIHCVHLAPKKIFNRISFDRNIFDFIKNHTKFSVINNFHNTFNGLSGNLIGFLSLVLPLGYLNFGHFNIMQKLVFVPANVVNSVNYNKNYSTFSVLQNQREVSKFICNTIQQGLLNCVILIACIIIALLANARMEIIPVESVEYIIPIMFWGCCIVIFSPLSFLYIAKNRAKLSLAIEVVSFTFKVIALMTCYLMNNDFNLINLLCYISGGFVVVHGLIGLSVDECT